MTSLGPLLGTTSNYGFNLVNFDWSAWHDYEHENWTVIDALLAAFIGINNVAGQWANNTSYTVGQRLVDGDDGTIWEVLVAHTSAASGTFAADRTANPTYWQSISPYTPIYKGAWANSVTYTKSDFVSDGYRYFIAAATHTSNAGGSIDDDISNWETLVDVSTAVTACTDAQTAAELAETNAETAQTAAELAETNAETAETAAVAAQAASEIAHRFLVDAKSSGFNATFADRVNYYRCTGSFAATIDKTGASIGQQLVVFSVDGNTTFTTTGLTVNLPTGKSMAPFGTNTTVVITYVATDTIDVAGDLANA